MMEKWKRSNNYMGEDYDEYYVLEGHTRDSGVLDESNFYSALRMMGGESDTVIVVRFSHWGVGWVEAILIHESDVESVKKGNAISEALENYPILNEDDYTERMDEEVERLKEIVMADYDRYKDDIAKYTCIEEFIEEELVER